jgi:dihydropyrimidine dehydrogenase (NADP+)
LFFNFFVQGLKDQGYQGVFIGIGLPQAKRIPIFENLSEQMGFYTSKDFLPKVSVASKPGMYTMRSLLYV